MELMQIILVIMVGVCFFEYDHLSSNNIRHDEKKYLVIGIVLLVALLYTIIFGETLECL